MKSILLIVLAIGTCACTIVNPIGHYQLRHFTKTTLTINEDKTFEFTKMSPNPTYSSLDHPDEDYFVTTGTWTTTNGKIILNSSNESGKDRLPVTIIDRERQSLRFSTYTFIDIFKDTVNVLDAKYSDGSVTAVLHGSMRNLKWTSENCDSTEVHFYGYVPYKYFRASRTK